MSKSKKRWKAVDGSRLSDRDAKIIGSHLDRIRERLGRGLKKEDIVKDAKSPSSPLHSYFEWNKDEAFVQYLLERAGYLLRSIEVIVIEGKKSTSSRAYMSVFESRDAEDRGYERVENVQKDPYMREQVIEMALAEAKNWHERYVQYSRWRKLKKIHKAIREAVMQ